MGIRIPYKQDHNPGTSNNGVRGSLVIKALCHKPVGRGFETRWGDLFFN
jgi:hypothetical protein